MRLRRFTGQSPRDAMARVKATLGPEAVILATRALEGGGVEITAAVDLDQLTVLAAPVPAGESTPALVAITRELGVLAARVARIDRALAPGAGAAGYLDEDAQDIAERLALNGTTPALAEAVARSFAIARRNGLAAAAALAASIERHLVVAAPSMPEPRVTAFVGPTGAGKTTTIAKLAARALERGASVGLVMADSHRVGAAAQLGSFARFLDVPLRAVCDGAELVQALGDFCERDVIYVDTAGLTGDANGAADLARLFSAAGGAVTTAAVVSAGTSETALRAAWRQLCGLAPATCVVTKVDEGGGLGTACGWLADVRVPLDWLGTGTRVPDDLMAADGSALAAWLTAA